MRPGRTGRLWAFEHSGVVLDALTTAKALAGGLPIGALLTGPRLADVFEPGDYGSTFAGGPVQAAAALAVLDVLDDEAAGAGALSWAMPSCTVSLSCPGWRRRAARPDARLRPHRGRCSALVERALLEERLQLNATGPVTVRCCRRWSSATPRSTTRRSACRLLGA